MYASVHRPEGVPRAVPLFARGVTRRRGLGYQPHPRVWPPPRATPPSQRECPPCWCLLWLAALWMGGCWAGSRGYTTCCRYAALGSGSTPVTRCCWSRVVTLPPLLAAGPKGGGVLLEKRRPRPIINHNVVESPSSQPGDPPFSPRPRLHVSGRPARAWGTQTTLDAGTSAFALPTPTGHPHHTHTRRRPLVKQREDGGWQAPFAARLAPISTSGVRLHAACQACRPANPKTAGVCA